MIKFCIYIFFLLNSFFYAEGALQEKILARVGETLISKSDLIKQRNLIKKNILKNHPLFLIYPKKLLFSKNKPLLKFMIYDLIIEKSVRKNPHFKNISSNKLDSSSKALFLNQILYSKIKISDEVLADKFFKKYKKNLFDKKTYHFLISSFKNEKIAYQFLNRLKRTSFEDLAKEFKQSEIKKSLKEGEINYGLKSILNKLKENQVSAPVIIGNQVYVLKLISKEKSLSESNQIKKVSLEQNLAQKKFKKELVLWLKKQEISHFVKSSL